MLKRFSVDWILLGSALFIVLLGLLTMYSCSGDAYFFERQLVWVGAGILVFFTASAIDWHFLRRGGLLVFLYLLALGLLFLLYIAGTTIRGAQSWFDLGGFSLQPADLLKLLLVLVLAKYFSRRHIEIAHTKHIVISGIYALIPFVLILLQPDFGLALIVFLIWLGIALVAGISKKHLAMILGGSLLGVLSLWFFIFTPIQQARVTSFLNPLADIQGAGYNAFQAMVAVGSGEWFGKGVCYGTQSRLLFLPEYQTDFIFAAFAEEWGLAGVLLLITLFGILFMRILQAAYVGETNFETLFAIGLLILLLAHASIHIGMNIGLLPVTGLPLPFMSYGGSHLLIEFLGIGILSSMRRYERATHRDGIRQEFLGL